MSATKTERQRGLPIGATPGRLAMVALLGVILAWVVVPQFLGSAHVAPVDSEYAAAPAMLPASTSPPTVSTVTSAAATANASWPEVDAERLARFNPFELPTWLVQIEAAAEVVEAAPERDATREQLAKSLATLRQQGAAAVLVVDGQRVALVGPHRLRVGDQIEGFVVKNISATGVELAEIK